MVLDGYIAVNIGMHASMGHGLYFFWFGRLLWFSRVAAHDIMLPPHPASLLILLLEKKGSLHAFSMRFQWTHSCG